MIAALVLLSAPALSQSPVQRGPAVPPVALTSHAPTEADYPPDSAAFGEEGSVGVRYVVSVSGDVSECEVEGSSGYERLDAAACTLVRRWKFKPATLRGNVVASIMRAEIVFQRSDYPGPLYSPSAPRAPDQPPAPLRFPPDLRPLIGFTNRVTDRAAVETIYLRYLVSVTIAQRGQGVPTCPCGSTLLL